MEIERLAFVEREASKRFKECTTLPPVDPNAPFLDMTFDSNTLLSLIDKDQVFVAVDETDASAPVIGLIIIGVKSGCAYIEEIDVLQEHGQKGVGKALLERSFEWARESGFNRMLLRTASNVPWNAPMYARLGFTPVAESDWDDDMKALDADEKSKGLPTADRVFMELSL